MGIKKINMITSEEFLKDKVREIDYEVPSPIEIMAWLDEYANQYKVKADKWDELDEKIGRFYSEDDDNEDEEGNLCDIGEVAALCLGYL
jgi:hypothetical protein